MEMATNFDAEEIKRLGKRFKKLDLVSVHTKQRFFQRARERGIRKGY